MKSVHGDFQFGQADVAPLVGAWIEIFVQPWQHRVALVAPLVGAWIEICVCDVGSPLTAGAPPVGAWIEITVPEQAPERQGGSLPSWERGLKFWEALKKKLMICRSPRGSVD